MDSSLLSFHQQQYSYEISLTNEIGIRIFLTIICKNVYSNQSQTACRLKINFFRKNEFKFLAINVKNQTLSLQFFSVETKTIFLLK